MTIITHPGPSAHFDEFFAIALILFTYSTQTFDIVRREPTIEELDDPNIWVVDIGNRHEPHLKNFDHHQDLSIDASFILVSKMLELHDKISQFRFTAWRNSCDVHGIKASQAKFDIQGNIGITYSPIEVCVLKAFAEDPNAAQPFMRHMVMEMMDYADSLQEGTKYWSQPERVFHIRDLPVWYSNDTDTVGFFAAAAQSSNPPAIRITRHKRGDGWSLYRCDDCPRVDFTLLQDDHRMAFVHKGGFIGSTKECLPIIELTQLIEGAIV